jgi:predicted Zn-ribbon and HTH transcriptional regulator
VEPAQCLDCSFVFRKRARLDRPSACPVCRSQHLGPPRFAVQPA